MKNKWMMAGFRGSRPILFYRKTLSNLRVREANLAMRALLAILFYRKTLWDLPAVLDVQGHIRKMRKWAGAVLLLAGICAFVPAREVHAEPVKIVIDPGHGGENLGAKYGGYTEKYMTMVVANAMAEELKKYEGIEVYMTRTEDVELSLQQRADYAKEVGADFFFCLHFNMSENHTLYGSEVWISAFGDCYAEGKSFGELCLDEMDTLELYRRGVKTRLNKDGLDYYGVIQHCEEYGIPSCIIEHCHLDHKEDKGRYETTEAMKKLGVLDATAVAKYYGLYSPETGKDYRRFEVPKVEVPAKVMKPDDTEPVDVSLTCLRVKEETGEVNLLLTGEDEDSGLLYYDYSFNGGQTYSGLQRWDAPGNELEFTVKVPADQEILLKCRVYNGYDLDAETETVEVPALSGKAGDSIKNTLLDAASVSGQEIANAGIPEPDVPGEGEMLETSGDAHQIDMKWYEERDAEKEKDHVLISSSDVSRFLWLVILGLLVSVLVVLVITRAKFRKQQKIRQQMLRRQKNGGRKKAGYTGRRR